MDKLRICYFSCADIFTIKLASAIRERGHEVALVTLHESRDSRLAKERVYYFPSCAARYNDLTYLVNWSHIKKVIGDLQPHIIHGLGMTNYAVYAVGLNRGGCLVSAVGSDVLVAPTESKWASWKVRLAARRSHIIHTDTPYIASVLHSRFGVAPSKIRVIPFGVDTTIFSQYGRQVDEDNKTILSLRWWEANYNIHRVLEAMTLVLRKVPKAKLVLAADGSLRREVINRIHKLRLGDYVELPGVLSPQRVAWYLRRTAVYVSIPQSDGTSASLLEAMACGAFPVVSKLPANEEWVRDGVNGFVVSSLEPTPLAERITEALENFALRRAAAGANWEVIHRRARWERNVTQFEEIYYELSRAKTNL